MRLKNFPIFYGWVVLALSFFGLFATFGIRASFSAYVIPWEEEFAISRTFVTVISVLSLATFGLFQPVMGRMTDRFGARPVIGVSLFLVGTGLILSSIITQLWQLAIVYGFIAAIGLAGASNVTSTALVAHWFVEKRGFAMGLVLSGMAMGQLIIYPLSYNLIGNFDWRFTMQVLGVFILLVVLPLCYGFIRSKPEDMSLRPYGEVADDAVEVAEPANGQEADGSNLGSKTVASSPSVVAGSVFSIFKERVFWYLTIPYFICGFTDVGLVGTHFIPFAEGKNYSTIVITAAISTIAAFNILGTIGTGYLSDKISRSKLLSSIYFIRGLTFILLLVTKDPVFLFVFAVLYGATEMASIAPTSALCAHLFKNFSIGAIFGFVSVSHQLGAAFGSLVPGVVYDFTGSYNFIFALSIVLIWGSGLLVLKVPDSQKFVAGSYGKEATVKG